MTRLLLVLLIFSPAIPFTDDATGYGPVFEEQPQDAIYAEEAPEAKFSMNCRARANPPATYKYCTPHTSTVQYPSVPEMLPEELALP
ncbi:hypothetical protein Z043_120682 [Scleropages formosus]|uniref:Uncharacterized protein n=1 Tax=Scleropages formosus TaxID=113540 RepID=A0A0P7WIZ1_SCLFO|nr:hypothetical protein Z043_120682 [Scleropages formosus]